VKGSSGDTNLQGGDTEDPNSATPISNSANSSNKAGRQTSATVRAEHVALVCILFSRMQEPPQLMMPLPAPPTLSAAAAQHAISPTASRASARIVSVASTATRGSGVHRLTAGGVNDEPRTSEIALSDLPSSRCATPKAGDEDVNV